MSKKRDPRGVKKGAVRGSYDTEIRYSERVMIRLTPEQKEKLATLGGAKWIRTQIDSAESE